MLFWRHLILINIQQELFNRYLRVENCWTIFHYTLNPLLTTTLCFSKNVIRILIRNTWKWVWGLLQDTTDKYVSRKRSKFKISIIFLSSHMVLSSKVFFPPMVFAILHMMQSSIIACLPTIFTMSHMIKRLIIFFVPMVSAISNMIHFSHRITTVT